MKTKVRTISSYSLGGLENQINDFLEDFAIYDRDLIDVKFICDSVEKRYCAMIIYAEKGRLR